MSDTKTDPEIVAEEIEAAFDGLAHQIGFSPMTAPIKSVGRAVLALQRQVQDLLAAHRELAEELSEYRRRSGPALAAARMHVPIGGGDRLWRADRARRQREKLAAAKQKLSAKTTRRK